MSTNSHWKPGDHVVFRGVWRQRIWFASPVAVVRDTPDLIALYWRAGTWQKLPREPLTPQDWLSAAQVELVDKTWVDTDVLMLCVPGASHSVYAMWEQGHTGFRCWYINLQDPLRRTPIGFNSMDHILDIVISPDRSKWRWKDEDDFNEAVAIGVYSAQKARAIRAEGERAIELMQANQSPFCDGWERWSPPPEWEIPTLPAGWDEIET